MLRVYIIYQIYANKSDTTSRINLSNYACMRKLIYILYIQQ